MRDSIENILRRRREMILERWFESLLDTYPPETARFLGREQDQFSNPVGRNAWQSLRDIFDGFLAGADAGALQAPLDGVLRIRSVQDFTASQAVAFVFRLKGILAEELSGRLREEVLREELRVWEARIDELGLQAFDVYMRCRDELNRIRTRERQGPRVNPAECAGCLPGGGQP